MRRSTSSSDHQDEAAGFSGPGPARNFLLCWALLAVIFLPGCLLTGGSGGGSTVDVTRTPDGPAMAMAAGLYQRGESLQTMAARGGAGYTSGSKRHYFKFETVTMKPGRIMFTALDPAGRPAFRLASDGQLITCILYGEKQYAVGPATAENFGRFLPLGITPDQLISLMTGSQVRPASAGARESGSSTELIVQPAGRPADDRHLWRLSLIGGLGQDPASTVIQSASFGPPRRPELSIKYLSVKNVVREDLGGRQEPFPHSVEVDWTDQNKQSLRVTYDEVRLGLTLPDTTFSLQRPDGFELIELP